ncbi:hypothetical protein EGR_00157 [Echinococcus granulosus]|uniref:Uncharacterized protein n=1 Tax=Echinococcus granulosus TaxID=6210 RepID=W6UU82_ECHGR|nr:hypothetical protein EGR_00157 [Echinococcus granulosus]EUB64888.1 hypothetical protein EGR_00157 [Echinococcus granulosus]
MSMIGKLLIQAINKSGFTCLETKRTSLVFYQLILKTPVVTWLIIKTKLYHTTESFVKDLGIWLANNGKAVKGHMLGSLLATQSGGNSTPNSANYRRMHLQPILLLKLPTSFVAMILIASTGAYPHWSVYDSLDTYDDYFDDFDQQYAQLQKRFLLGLGLTKNTPENYLLKTFLLVEN